jgi:hypothetical protein
MKELHKASCDFFSIVQFYSLVLTGLDPFVDIFNAKDEKDLQQHEGDRNCGLPQITYAEDVEESYDECKCRHDHHQ